MSDLHGILSPDDVLIRRSEMKATYVSSLKEGAAVDCAFALRSKELRATRTREAYLSMEVGDRTGRISAVMFRPNRAAQAIPSGSIVHVRGTVTTYRGIPRISVESMSPVQDYCASDMLPSSPRDVQELIDELRALVRSVRHPALAKLLRQVFGDKSFFARFIDCPADQARHHAYVGGLLEHTVAVATMGEHLAGQYPEADRDLLVTAALLHDIGVVDALEYSTSIDCTDAGRLLGHAVLGERRLQDALRSLPDVIPPDVQTRLSHIVISHHGETDTGASRRPSTLEGLIVQQADETDSRASAFIEASKAALIVDERWTDASNTFNRPLLVPRSADRDLLEPVPSDHQLLRKGA